MTEEILNIAIEYKSQLDAAEHFRKGLSDAMEKNKVEKQDNIYFECVRYTVHEAKLRIEIAEKAILIYAKKLQDL